MAASPYKGLEEREPTLRDYLAVDRTVLANERTFLSYVRTALALVVVGASAIKFLEPLWATVSGWAFIAMGVATLAAGVWRFQRTWQRITTATQAHESPARPPPRLEP